jgi:asparagine synthase (glutamine-hydrolysing)
MTAFAAVLYPPGAPQPPHAVSRVGAALAAVTGRPAASIAAGRCTLALAPLHSTDPRAPVVDARGAIGVVGQALFEDNAALNGALGLPRTAHPLSTAAAAYERWGDRFTEHVSGEFALAIWDRTSDRLICARDGLGIRVLYVAEGREIIVATNVIGAALAHPAIPPDVDSASVVSFLSVGDSGDAVATAYRAVKAVPEGHTLAVGTRPALRRHWWMPQPETQRATAAEIVEGYRAVLASAVTERLADRTAVYLSGGIDSTSIAAAVPPSTEVNAFTVDYRRFGRCDELRYARQAAASLKLPLSVIPGDDCDPLAAASPALPVDEPTLGDWRHALNAGSAYASAGLWGEDGDSLFQPSDIRELLRAANPLEVGRAAAAFAISTGRRPYLGLRVRERLGLTKPVGTVVDWLTPAAVRMLEGRDRPTLAGLRPQPTAPHPTRSAADRRLTTNVARSFAISIDAQTTGARIELRFPLLDSRVIRYVFSVPSIPWCQRKTLPRAAFRDVLPASIIGRPKTPVTGFNEWLVERWRAGAATANRLVAVPPEWIDVDRWHAALAAGSTNEAMAAWRVLMLDQWLMRVPQPEATCTV